MASSTPQQSFTVTLRAGETVVLPSDAIISGVFVDGDAEVTSSCTGTLPPSTNYRCGVFYMNIDDDSSNNHPNDENFTYYTRVRIGALEYDLDGRLRDISDPEYLNAYISATAIFKFTHISRFSIDDSGDNKRTAVYLYFKVAETFYDDLQLLITSHVGHLRPSPQWYSPLTDDVQEGADDLDCNEYPF